MGREEIVRTLGTRDLTIAKRPLHAVLAGIQRDIATAEANRELSPESAEYLLAAAREARKALQALRDWLGTDVEVTGVVRRIAGRCLTESLMKRAQAAKTTKTELSHISSCWNWMLTRGVVEVNPWLRMGSSLPTNKRGTEAPRRPWTDSEIVQLIKGTPTNDPPWSFSALALYSASKRSTARCFRLPLST
jgi:hypothetical protein